MQNDFEIANLAKKNAGFHTVCEQDGGKLLKSHPETLTDKPRQCSSI